MLENIILLLVGAAVFITGMNVMSSGLRKATGKSIKRMLKKIQNNAFAGLGIGAGVTALIQSSAATSVMALGFINASVMTVFQGVCIILGAYVGTTVTGVLASLSSFSFSSYLILFTVLGVILMFFKKDKIKNIGEIFCGLGLLFFGLQTMSSSFKEGSELLNVVKSFFTTINFPLLLLVIGMLFTALVQSSSATSGIVIVLVGQGAMTLQSGFYVVLGATIGTIITMILATIGGNANAKRTTSICLFNRVICALIALGITVIFETQFANFFLSAFKTPQLAVAMFLVFYNIIFMFAFLPFVRPIVKLSNKLIKDKSEEKIKQSIKFIDKHLLDTPTLAMMQVKKEISNMMNLSYNNFLLGYERIMSQNKENDQTIIETEDKIDYINKAITSYLIDLTHYASRDDEKLIGSYFHAINDIERIGDHAYNFYEMSVEMADNELTFSSTAKEEMKEMVDILTEMFNISSKVFTDDSDIDLNYLHELEDKTDKLKTSLSVAHYHRITEKKCKMELSPYYSSLLSELERVADHLTNIGYSIVSPTGDEN